MRKLQSVIASAAKQSLYIDCFVAVLLAMTFALPVYAADKNWTGEGDGTDWFDDTNWLPDGKPASSENAKVDLTAARVEVGQAFEAQSLIIGGKKDSEISVSNFVNGELSPSNSTDNSAIVRRDGKLILKGSSGKIKLKGTYKDSEEIIPDEPSFLLYVK